MNKIYYIAKKIHNGNSEDKKVSQPITRIARLSIIIAMAINIVTLAVVTGFQNQVKDKVIGFGSHATILKAGEYTVFETDPILFSDSLIKKVKHISGIKSIQPFAYKPALLQSEPDSNFYTINGIDTFQVQQEIHGCVVKGVSKDFDWTFFETHLVEGEVPNVSDSIPYNEILISSHIAKNLNLNPGDEVNMFIVRSSPLKLKYKVTGIFKTGLQEFDEQVILGDIRNVQLLNDWGIQAAIRVADTVTKDGQMVIYSEVRGGNGNYRYDWGNGYENAYGFTYCDTKDTVIRLIASDYQMFMDGFGEINTTPDTAYLKVQVEGNKNLACYPEHTEFGEIQWDYLNEEGTQFAIDIQGGKRITFEYIDGKGSFHNYIGGYEVEVHNFDRLDEISTEVKRAIYFQDINHSIEYRMRTIKEDQEDIFLWLDFLNINVVIILVLMILVGTINMSSGLLVLIITKTQLIGLLKALGASNWDVRKLFLYQSVFIIVRGMLIGNLIGVGFCLLQHYFTIIPLNPEVYYLDAVPVEIKWGQIALLNIGTLLVCTAALLIPSYVITKISPIKALKFD